MLTIKTNVGLKCQKKIQYSKKTITAAQTRYFISSVETWSKLFHASDVVHGRSTRISSRIVSQYSSGSTSGTITYVARVNKFKYSHVSRVKMKLVIRDTYLLTTIIRF